MGNVRIKVLHLITELERGGAELLLLDMCRQLRESLDITVAYLRGPGSLVPELQRLDIPVHCLRMRSRADISAVWRLWRLLRRGRFTIIHTHLIDADLVGFIAARLAGVPVIISTKHNTDDFRQRQSLVMKVDSWFANRLDKIIAVSHAVAQMLVQDQHVVSGKIQVVHNGIDTERFQNPDVSQRQAARQSFKFAPPTRVITTVARLHPQKGHRYVLQAIPAVVKACGENICFVWAGEGPLQHELEALADELDVRRFIRFLGCEQNIPQLLAGSDVFVLASLWEGLGIAVLEAQASGVAVIASRVDGLAEVIDDGVSGCLVAARDPDALAQAIIRLLNDPEQCRRLAKEGRRIVEQKFSLAGMCRELLGIYQELVSRKRL